MDGDVLEESDQNRKETEVEEQTNVDDNAEVDLLNLPPEIFLHICSYLNAKFILTTLTVVCKSLHALLSDASTWKIRLTKRWMQRYPPIPVDDETFNWKLACMEREEQCRLWSEYEKNMHFKSFTSGIYAPVDTVHLGKGGRFVAAGSRDGNLHVWDLNKIREGCEEEDTILHNKNVGKAWLWTVTSKDNIVTTGSWNSYIKFWDLEADCAEVFAVKCKSAVLCSLFVNDILYAGCYNKEVYAIDSRVEKPIVFTTHRRSVLCLGADEKYVISGSEDQTIKIVDRTAGKVFKTIEFEYFPMCLSYGLNQLWIGDKKGRLHLFNTNNHLFEPVMSCESGHNGKLTGVIHNLGSIMTGCTDSVVQVLHPSSKPSPICTITQHQEAVAAIDFQNEVLVSGGCDARIGLWWPVTENRWRD
ncbi:F-box/WD repeat-containing protein 9-like [Tubulanus polymorphus]|uniref:F-box/WD repeat-containing protein 9-like n=1 Tax=Tubulanus polymorphus TaxID=672921 RepID=UPI003DA32286